jgi:phytoene desaturase
MKRIVVVGAGLGGLSAAIRLAREGFAVTVLEKNERVGGKMNIWKEAGYTFDTGPTLLTMPFVIRDLFESAGERMEDYIELVPLDPICRYVFPDGSRLDASSDIPEMENTLNRMRPGEGTAFRTFLNHGKRIYDAAAGPFLFTGFGSMGLRGTIGYLRFLPSVFRIDAFRTLDRAVRAAFKDERARQMMNRFATYNGSSPYRVPATLAIIPYVEFAMGGWYVRGGMYGLARALEKLAAGLGVLIRTSSPVAGIDVRDGAASGVRLASGEEVRADAVISNVDAFHTGRELLRGPEGSGLRREREPSLSGFVMMLGVRRELPQLAHHNVFFSADYRKEFSALFGAQTPADDPTIYVSVSARTDPSHAPAGGSNLFVLVNAPAISGKYDWEKRSGEYRNLVLARLASKGFPGLERAIETERVITPLDFERQYGAYRGGIYGTSSNGMFSAFLRPPNKPDRPKRLYLAGGSSHPGGGIPLVLLSGKIVAAMVREEITP